MSKRVAWLYERMAEMSTNKAFDKWMARIQDTKTPWTEQEIIYFRKAIGLAGIKSEHLRNCLRTAFNSMNPYYSITREQSEKGRKYLLDKSLKKNGQKRKGCKLGEWELDILRNPDMVHYFVGLHQPQASLEYYLPVYRAIVTGETCWYFEYIGASYELMEVIG